MLSGVEFDKAQCVTQRFTMGIMMDFKFVQTCHKFISKIAVNDNRKSRRLFKFGRFLLWPNSNSHHDFRLSFTVTL